MCLLLLLTLSWFQTWASTNPRGAERLPPGIVVRESDFYLRRLWGHPEEPWCLRSAAERPATLSVVPSCHRRTFFSPKTGLVARLQLAASGCWLLLNVQVSMFSVLLICCHGDIQTCMAMGARASNSEPILVGILIEADDLLLEFLISILYRGHQVISHWDLTSKPKYLVTFTVGYDQKANIDTCVKKFSENFTILLFHYDGCASEWEDLEWSKRAIHVSACKQTKWWYAKRFLHPDIVASYEYIFIWDEDLGVEHFNAEEYLKLVKKHGLEISQPGLEPNSGLTWQMTKRRGDSEVHKLPFYTYRFIEIMAPVFSRSAWRCVWHMIQNDLVHGWGLDFALRKCVEPAHEKIGVIDSQWIVHQSIPSLGNQGETESGKAPWEGVRERCRREWTMFQDRMATAEQAYFESLGVAISKTAPYPTQIMYGNSMEYYRDVGRGVRLQARI
ncbi:hypothetical protein Cgig2_026260 [Carnegiea gigantea]|uniref:Storage protein n=1 Tax=Carnegiea gigantea TaxID=171969 RepID=A0A9Q1GYV0_9CARY|nr:hypothetical protein Cgig2_026260 [Carnegiea gigantea]